MAIARRDQNDIAVGLGVSSTDNSTPIRLAVDPVTGYLLANLSSDSLTIISATQNKRDQNDRPTMYGVSNSDGITLLPIRTDSTGKLLVKLN